ncbi:hypothetical protein RJ639_033867 [Escallonia herrerae]|uniref:DDT domain-containing protein n=1 Tax=Escallonia herrerae TaxID=1293975 RepID=A0AA89BC90_9ASTE|nr:hypothetical protein RJ639_033867 [Escallonia herrerae]
MAVASSSGQKQKKNGSRTEEATSQQKPENGGPPAKRTRSPGVRVVHGRIYDSENGKTCHQCRQKTLDFVAACKNEKNNKMCTMKFCHTCLLNRYGEKAEEVEALDEWSCPRCRGICNCSICMKKNGHQPTGMLVRTAKATGFSSVSDLLHVKGHQNCHDKLTKEIGAFLTASEKESPIVSPGKLGKENSFDGKMDTNIHSVSLASNMVNKKPKKMKCKGLKDVYNAPGNDLVFSKEAGPQPNEKKKSMKTKHEKLEEMQSGNNDNGASWERNGPHTDKTRTKKAKREECKEMHNGEGDDVPPLEEVSPKKPRVSYEIYNKEVGSNVKVDSLQEEKGSKTGLSNKVSLDPSGNEKRKDRDVIAHKDVKVLYSQKNQHGERHKLAMQPCKNRNSLNFESKDLEANPIPQGTELTAVAGIDLPLEDVGNALQFLEFCAAFGKILDVKKGKAELVLRELIDGRSRRSGLRAHHSIVVQFHIQLLSLIQEDSGTESPTLSPTHGKDSWLLALKNCIAESQCSVDLLPFDCLDRRAGGYDTLDFSMRLRLLIFLCDEILGTEKLRNWIDEQDSKAAEKAKEAKEKVIAAKDKEKHLRQKRLDEVAKAIIAKNGAPLSIQEHEAIVSQIKFEAAQAHTEMLELKGMIPKKKRSDAVRTEPVLLDTNGRAYWRLNSYSDGTDILLQDLGTDCKGGSGGKWFAYDHEQKEVIEKHISFRYVLTLYLMLNSCIFDY